jgi:hypothetical protein
MGRRARHKRIYRLLRAEGISKKKATRAADRLARDPDARLTHSKLAALGGKAKALSGRRPKLRRPAHNDETRLHPSA